MKERMRPGKNHNCPTEAQMAWPQEVVMRTYRRKGFVKGKDDEWALHMFFSPWRAPSELTAEEVRTCIELYPRKDAYQKARIKAGTKVLAPHLRRKSVTKKGKRILSLSPTMQAELVATFHVPFNCFPSELASCRRMTRGRFRKGIEILKKEFEFFGV